MPFSDPTSVYLDALARKRAQAEALMQNSKEAGAGIVGGLEAAEGLRVRKVAEDRQAAQDAAAAAQQATENERAAEGMRIKKREEDRNAAQARYGVEGDILARQRQQTLDAMARNAAATEEGRAAQVHGLAIREKTAKADDATRATAGKSAVDTYLSIQNEGGDHETAMAHAAGVSGLSEAEIGRMVAEDTRKKVQESEARQLATRKMEAEIAKLQRAGMGGGSGKPDPLKDAKERKAIADAALAESKAADIGKPVDWDEIDKLDARKLRDAKSSAAGAIESAKAMLAVLDDPEKAKYIGKYRGAFEAGKEALGIGSDASGIRAGMAARFNQYKNLISGAAVSDREKPDLTRVMPDDIDINPDDLRQKILEGIKYAERQYGLASKVLDAGTTKILDAPAAQSSAPIPTADEFAGG